MGYDPAAVTVQYIHPTTTIAQFRSWVDTARATRTWLVLVYHSFEANPQKVDDTTPQAFAEQMADLRSSGVPTRTVDDAVTLLARDPDTVAPRTAVTGPANGDTVSAGTVTVTASATDDHAVTAVDLLVDGLPVQTDGTAPYAFDWTATPGTHTVRTRAHDAAGHTGTSPPVTVEALTELAAETFSGTAWPAGWNTEVSNGHVDVSADAGRLAFDDVRYAYADADPSTPPPRPTPTSSCRTGSARPPAAAGSRCSCAAAAAGRTASGRAPGTASSSPPAPAPSRWRSPSTARSRPCGPSPAPAR